VAVALDSGQLFFLRTDTGACAGESRSAGGRTAPVADPWLGLIWTVSHSRQLTLTRDPGDWGAPVTVLIAEHSALAAMTAL
jgi:hypothetical protein